MTRITIFRNTASRNRSVSVGRAAAWIALGLMLLITVTPLWMVVKTALMQSTALYTESDRLLPTEPTLDNFKAI